MALVLSHWPRFSRLQAPAFLEAVEIGEDAVLVGEHQAAPGLGLASGVGGAGGGGGATLYLPMIEPSRARIGQR